MKRAIVIGVLVVSLLVAGAGPAVAQTTTSPDSGVTDMQCTDSPDTSDDMTAPGDGGDGGDGDGGSC